VICEEMREQKYGIDKFFHHAKVEKICGDGVPFYNYNPLIYCFAFALLVKIP